MGFDGRPEGALVRRGEGRCRFRGGRVGQKFLDMRLPATEAGPVRCVAAVGVAGSSEACPVAHHLGGQGELGWGERRHGVQEWDPAEHVLQLCKSFERPPSCFGSEA